jgi:homeobox protein OTX1
VWFKNRRAKCRQQLQHQTSSNLNSSKTSSSASAGNTSSSSSRHPSNTNNNNTSSAASGNNNNSSTNNSKTNHSNGSSASKSTSIKHVQGNPTGNNNHNNNNNNSSNNNNNNNINNNSQSNGLGLAHTSSPILPITPSTSVSPPINVICKKEISSYHSLSSSGLVNDLKSTAGGGYDSLKDNDMGLTGHHGTTGGPYINVNSRLGQTGGNLTPLGSNSSIMTTPSPPITPQASHNPLSYVPNHESYNFWHNQYNQYSNNYQTPSYYSQMDYFQNQSQANYNMGHSGYATSNFGLSSGPSLTGAMGAQSFSQNGLDYMSPQDKYVNMV